MATPGRGDMSPFLKFAERRYLSPLLAGGVTTVFICILTGLLSYWVYTVRLHDEYQETANVASDARDRLRIALIHGLSATQTIALCVEQGILPREFDTVAPRIAEAYGSIDAVELTIKGVVRHVYPYEENKRAIGFDILSDPVQKDEALLAIRNRSLIFAGPLNLVQGGLAVVGRGPVFLERDGKEEFWGFTIVILRMPTIIKYGRLDQLEAKGYSYRLAKRNPQTGAEIPFFNSDVTLNNPVSERIVVPNGEWVLEVAPTHGWSAAQRTIPTMLLSLLLSFVGGVFVWYMARQPELLKRLVDDRTAELLRSERRLNASLKEKELLLKEIHHRVKNNLQVISSLLGMQSQTVTDGQAREAYADSIRRIRSMAMVHENLYRSDDLSQINFQEYLLTMTRELGRSLHRDGIELRVDAENITLGIDTAVPCGLIVNELVSNALKHAFPKRDNGIVVVTFKRLNESTLLLEVHDNGIGFPRGSDFRSMSSMGMSIIRTLTDQISGTIKLDSSAGTRFSIVYPG